MELEKRAHKTNVLTDSEDLPWHKPEIEQLTVSLDTASTPLASGPDFVTHGFNTSGPTGG